MKPLRNTVLAIGVVLSVLVFQGMALSAEQSGNKGEATGTKSSSKTLAQTVEEIRNSINEGWHKLTDPKTTEPTRDEVNKVWKNISDAASAAVRSEKPHQQETKDRKDK
ncbi:MAG TPA: hypothetical protein VES96_07210 [Nitrospiraceae bacterium]|jgi:gas vesicle protein|nr:hypothetical protein [Nitrospiraceae bacterium]